MKEADVIIAKLDLKPLPEEGGYYRETYRSDSGRVPAKSFGIEADSNRVASTGIYFLVVPESFSALHRVKSDEMFHFYAGSPVELVQIDENGNLEVFEMGSDILNGQTPQVLVRRQVWQGLRLKDGGKWALMGTTVAPGFEFEDFEVGRREELVELFPRHAREILNFTRAAGEKTHPSL